MLDRVRARRGATSPNQEGARREQHHEGRAANKTVFDDLTVKGRSKGKRNAALRAHVLAHSAALMHVVGGRHYGAGETGDGQECGERDEGGAGRPGICPARSALRR